MSDPTRIATVVGARPQFVKAAVVSSAIKRRGAGRETLIHTGQHFDTNMSDVFFREMDLPPVDTHLGIHGGSHAAMTGRMLEALERTLLDARPDWVLVYGDTNSTLAGALAAAKLGLPVTHVEAGLRSFDRSMPEEINRVVTDHLATMLFAPTTAALANLRSEGIDADRIELVGDVMYDALLHFGDVARERSRIIERLGLHDGRYVLATVHRAGNTDRADRLTAIVGGLLALGRVHPVVVPLHPRTRQALKRFDLLDQVERALRVIEPQGYLDMLRLEAGAALIATDSGGVQKEAYMHGVPCLTLRDETEWIELVEIGANTLVGADANRIEQEGARLFGHRVTPVDGLYGNGNAAERIAEALCPSPTAAPPAPPGSPPNPPKPPPEVGRTPTSIPPSRP